MVDIGMQWTSFGNVIWKMVHSFPQEIQFLMVFLQPLMVYDMFSSR